MQLTVLAKRAFPKFKTRLAIRRAAFFPLDVFDFLAGRRDPLVPPRGLWFVGGGNFRDNQLLESFIRIGDLQRQNRVLDVGCGIGKQAVPLTQYLTAGGSYEGMSLPVLFVAGLFTHHGDACRARAFAEHGLRGVTVKIASAAALNLFAKSAQRRVVGYELGRCCRLCRHYACLTQSPSESIETYAAKSSLEIRDHTPEG